MNKVKKVKNIKRITIVFLSAVIVIGVIIYCSSEFLDKNYNKESSLQKTFNEINISEYRIEKSFENTITQRIIKILNHKVFVGETIKEIENGYYDIKLYIQDNKCIVIHINKLWKEFDRNLYEEDYVSQISGSLQNMLGINIPENKIYDYILSGYLVAKNVDNNSNDSNEYILDLDDYVIKGKILEKEFVMSIYEK